jgi:hypothetical protein
LCDQRVNAAFDFGMLVDLHQHVAFPVQQHDFVVHGVLAAIGQQASMDDVRILLHAGDEFAEVAVGGEKAHIGRALIQIAHHDIDHVVRLGADLHQHIRTFFVHQARNQFVLQLVEPGPRRRHGLQDRLGLGQIIHLGRRLDHAPHQIQFAQGLLAADNVAHVRKEHVILLDGGMAHRMDFFAQGIELRGLETSK